MLPEFLGIMPYCYLSDPALVSLVLVSSFVLFVGYAGIGVIKCRASIRKRLPYWPLIAVTFMLCGLSHAARIYAMYTQNYWVEAVVLIMAAVVSVPTLIGVWRLARLWQAHDEEAKTAVN